MWKEVFLNNKAPPAGLEAAIMELSPGMVLPHREGKEGCSGLGAPGEYRTGQKSIYARFLTDPPLVAGVSDFKHVREVWRSLRTSAIDRCSQGGPRGQLTLELTSELLVVKCVRLH